MVGVIWGAVLGLLIVQYQKWHEKKTNQKIVKQITDKVDEIEKLYKECVDRNIDKIVADKLRNRNNARFIYIVAINDFTTNCNWKGENIIYSIMNRLQYRGYNVCINCVYSTDNKYELKIEF